MHFNGKMKWGYGMDFALKRSEYDRQFFGKIQDQKNPPKVHFLRHFPVGEYDTY